MKVAVELMKLLHVPALVALMVKRLEPHHLIIGRGSPVRDLFQMLVDQCPQNLARGGGNGAEMPIRGLPAVARLLLGSAAGPARPDMPHQIEFSESPVAVPSVAGATSLGSPMRSG